MSSLDLLDVDGHHLRCAIFTVKSAEAFRIIKQTSRSDRSRDTTVIPSVYRQVGIEFTQLLNEGSNRDGTVLGGGLLLGFPG